MITSLTDNRTVLPKERKGFTISVSAGYLDTCCVFLYLLVYPFIFGFHKSFGFFGGNVLRHADYDRSIGLNFYGP